MLPVNIFIDNKKSFLIANDFKPVRKSLSNCNSFSNNSQCVVDFSEFMCNALNLAVMLVFTSSLGTDSGLINDFIEGDTLDCKTGLLAHKATVVS